MSEEIEIELLPDGDGNEGTIEIPNGDNDETQEVVQQEGGQNQQDSDLIEIPESKNTEIDDPSVQDSDSPSSALTPFIRALDTEGIIKYNEDEAKKFESEADYLKSALDKEISDRMFANLSGEQKDFLDALEKGVRFEDYVSLKAEQENSSYSDESVRGSESIQEVVYKKYLLEKGYTEEDARELVSDAKALKKLESKAVTANAGLRDIIAEKDRVMRERSEQAKLDREKSNKASYDNAKSYVDKQDEIIPGIPVSQKQRASLFEKMTVPVREENGTPISFVQDVRSKDSLGFDTKLNYYAEIGLFDENPNVEEIVKHLKTKQANNLDAISRDVNMSLKSTGIKRKTESSDSSDLLNFIDSNF